ncbi:MAG: hypothetical protein ABII90_13280 [Bacteroidota bacterium]
MKKNLQYLIFSLFLLPYTFHVSGQDTRFQKFKTLSCSEKRWVMTHPFVAGKTLKISENARRIAKEMLKDTLMDNYENGGKADAFRHAFWMASLASKIRWRKAYKLGKAHERGNKKDFNKNRYEEGILPDAVSCEMDLWNNKIGLVIGRNNKSVSEDELTQLIKQAVLDGRCKIIKMDKNGNFLDESGKIIPAEEWQGKWENRRCLVESDY